ncbi:MAG: class I SAM-dependent methyltransferase [Lachnospiraceae bacterium]|nr:class I SAM-dependent methyltransferase [Lachnospiraceae bacterium]
MNENFIKQWDDAAECYAKDQEQSVYADANKRIIKERFKEFNGEIILDLGCGYGYYTDYFNSIGACAIGTDASQKMIDIARKKYPKCEFLCSDITSKLPFEKESFDIVFCNQVLMDIEDLKNVFGECHRVLKEGGILYYSIIHPAFFNGEWKNDEKGGKAGKLISSYITPFSSSNHFWGETLHFHRPLSYYLNTASDAGFVLLHTKEPKIYDGKDKNEDLPLFFFAEYKK